MITIEGVGKRYRRVRWVLKEIDVGVPPGQITVITGENGSGKSTLLRIAAGCTRPTVGRVRGRPRTVGYVPEKFPQAVPLSTSAYLRHMAGVRGLSSADADAAHAVLDRLGFVGDRDESDWTGQSLWCGFCVVRPSNSRPPHENFVNPDRFWGLTDVSVVTSVGIT